MNTENKKKRIVIKLSGEVLALHNQAHLAHILEQISALSLLCNIGLVIGGGNFFRGNSDSKRFGICDSAGHEVGMLATIMNGRIIQNLLHNNNVPTVLMSALSCPSIAKPLTSQGIAHALAHNTCMIFVGGTGNPFVTTDTNAVIRALQIGADELWKATTVDGLYNTDPKTSPHAQLIEKISLEEALTQKLGIMDRTALALAAQYNMKIRVFNLFRPKTLIEAYNNQNFGSTLY